MPHDSGWFYVSTPRWTAAIRLEEGVVTDGPPICKDFIGRRADEVLTPIRRQPDTIVRRIA